MLELRARSPLEGQALPQGSEVRLDPLYGLKVRVLRLSASAAPPAGLPGPGRSEGPWFNIGPREWLHIAAEPPDDARAVEITDALVGFSLEGRDVADLLAAGCTLDLDRFAVGGVTRTRLGEIPVVLQRTGQLSWRMYAAAPLSRYLIDWIAHHV
jgi:heterotetrameric sarcosine oxidase gamma subunit